MPHLSGIMHITYLSALLMADIVSRGHVFNDQESDAIYYYTDKIELP